ncbi:MAG: hypothetical protein P4L69_19600, partial [Desulfosporosinus sp.]|nr:hypothetical protein [Desulfosporosinus sp.]
FVVNGSKKIFRFDDELTPNEVSVLISLLTSGAEIEYLALCQELPAGTGAELGEAIKCSGKITELRVFGYIMGDPSPELFQLIVASLNPALEHLTIRSVYDENMHQLCDGSPGKQRLTMLRSLKIKDCEFRIPLLAKWISSLQALESLVISRTNLIPSDVKALAAAMRKLPAVTDLSLCEVTIETEDWQQFGGNFFGKLTKLSLNSDKLKDEGIAVIVDEILASRRRRCGLEKLSLYFNGIGPAGAQKLSELIACSPHLRHLCLGRNPLEVGIASQVLEKCASSLEVLDVGDCRLGPREAVSLFAHDYCALTILKITCNKVGDTGVGAVAQLLLHSSGRTLKVLKIGENNIGEAGALVLAKGLAKAYAIRIMYANKNPLGPRGATAILDALAAVSTVPIDKIYMYWCEIGNAGASAAGKLIMRRGCRQLDLDNNSIHFKGAKAIADSLNSSACTIEKLNLLENWIGDEGIKYLLKQIILKPGSVCKLLLDLCGIGVEGSMAIRQAIETQGALKKLMYVEHIKGMDESAKAILREAEGISHNLKYTEIEKLYE